MNTPVYSAIGKITEMMVLGRAQPTHSGRVTLTGLSHLYKKVKEDVSSIEVLLEKNNAVVYLFFDPDINHRLPSRYFLDGINYLAAPPGDSLDDFYWSQDLLHFAPPKPGSEAAYRILCYATGNVQNPNVKKRLPVWVEDQLKISSCLDFREAKSSDKLFSGGNVAIGYGGADHYMIVGNPDWCELNKSEISEEFNIPENRIFFCTVKDEETYVKEFYHLDLYLTIAGKTGKRKDLEAGCEKVLVAYIYGPYAELNPLLDAMCDRLLGEAPFLCIERMPCIMLPVNGERRIYPYNNCLVENYYDEDGNRVLNFYMPCYSQRIMDDGAKILSTLGVVPFLEFADGASLAREGLITRGFNEQISHSDPPGFLNLVNTIQETVMKMESEKEKSALHEGQLELVREAEEELKLLARMIEPGIEKQLIAMGATQVHFLPGDFIAEAAAKAGLHCRVKAIKRERVHLE